MNEGDIYGPGKELAVAQTQDFVGQEENGALEGTWLFSLVQMCQRMIKRYL